MAEREEAERNAVAGRGDLAQSGLTAKRSSPNSDLKLWDEGADAHTPLGESDGRASGPARPLSLVCLFK
jgi:hypothetical protein